MKDKQIQRLVVAALLAALTCVATMVIRIPVPGTSGYVHPGDAMVILCGVILGPQMGLLAAGIGSALADLLGGYFIYVPITFIVKGLVGLLSGLACVYLSGRKVKPLVIVIIGGIIDMIIVAIGYFIPEIFLYGMGAAAMSILPNLMQGASGLILATVLYVPLAQVLKGELTKFRTI
ncbi:MAG: ECF transporter S component [Lachnospiraceae bacterium]|nr:ECF transporter S component [Candidatus Equihabitans merdae]